MSTTKNLLVELRVEELPPKALKKLGESFATTLAASLKSQGLAGEQSAVTSFATPRRLAVQVSGVAAHAPDQAIAQKLMPVSVGLTADGQPTPALLKKLAAIGASEASVPALRRQIDGKAETLYLDGTLQGAMLADGLQKALDEALAKLPIDKRMQYQLADGWASVSFVRPAHGLVALHGADVVPVTALGLESGRETLGHRFEAQMTPVVLQNADHYSRQLEDQGAVIASFEARRGEVARQLQAAAAREGLVPIDDDALLDEVTALVERPHVLLCQFEREFLDVPPECLILTMKANQKYFPLLDDTGRLTNKFLVVANISPDDTSHVIGGNERVVRPRLADAKFFFDQDRKKSLASRVPGLDKVVYHAQLGTMGERVERVRAIAKAITALLQHDELTTHRSDEAARLAKADLLSDMVGEFPELQGTMGRYYAHHDGSPDDVALAIEDQYKPRFAGDDLPRNAIGIVLAMADKLETLLGMFEIGEAPTGDRDPFALRRHALGVLRMCMERRLHFSLERLIDVAGEAWTTARTASEVKRRQAQARASAIDSGPSLGLRQSTTANDRNFRLQLLSFMRDRLAVTFRDKGFSTNEVEAVLSVAPIVPSDCPQRLEAVRAFSSLPEASSLAAANKRITNILKKVEGNKPIDFKREAEHLPEASERRLVEVLDDVAVRAKALFDLGDYSGSLLALAALKTPVDAFFDSVMVNADDPQLRANRLGLLAQLHAAMNRVADLSKLAA